MGDSFSARLELRSVLSFFVLMVFVVATALFLLKKADEAVNEFKVLASQEVYLKSDSELMSQNGNFQDTPLLSTAGWKTYRNEKYGFEVKLPPRWSNAVIEEIQDKGYGGVFIMLKLLSKVIGGYQAVCYFSIYPSANWDALQNSDEPKPSYLAKHNNTVYGSGCGQDDYGYVGFEEYNKAVDNQRFSSLPAGPYNEFGKLILPTLKFVK